MSFKAFLEACRRRFTLLIKIAGKPEFLCKFVIEILFLLLFQTEILGAGNSRNECSYFPVSTASNVSQLGSLVRMGFFLLSDSDRKNIGSCQSDAHLCRELLARLQVISHC